MRLLLLVPLLAVACAPVAPITTPPVAVSFASEARQSAVTGIDTITVRARLRTEDTSGELAAVPCRLSGPGYEATFRTPAILELPVFGNDAPQLALSCRFEGETQSRSLTAQNLSEAERQRQRQQLLDDLRENGDGVGVALTIGLGNTRPRGFDTFSYPSTTFTFRR